MVILSGMNRWSSTAVINMQNWKTPSAEKVSEKSQNQMLWTFLKWKMHHYFLEHSQNQQKLKCMNKSTSQTRKSLNWIRRTFTQIIYILMIITVNIAFKFYNCLMLLWPWNVVKVTESESGTTGQAQYHQAKFDIWHIHNLFKWWY